MISYSVICLAGYVVKYVTLKNRQRDWSDSFIRKKYHWCYFLEKKKSHYILNLKKQNFHPINHTPDGLSLADILSPCLLTMQYLHFPCPSCHPYLSPNPYFQINPPILFPFSCCNLHPSYIHHLNTSSLSKPYPQSAQTCTPMPVLDIHDCPLLDSFKVVKAASADIKCLSGTKHHIPTLIYVLLCQILL